MNKKKYPLVSIIIPHYNNFQILDSCIDSLKKITYPKFEIIIIDNNSTDNSPQKIKKKYKDIIIKSLNKNHGYAEGCNIGSKLSKGDYLLFLNNDTIHEKSFLEPLVDKINSNKKIASVQPKIKNAQNKELFDYAGASGGFLDYFVFPFTRGRIFNFIEKDLNQYNNSIKVFWTSGTCFLTKKYVFEKVKGFDSRLFAHMEEIDYCWKCYLIGYENWVEPISTIYHYGGKTLSYNSYKKTYLNHRNSLILFLSNYNLSLSLYLLPTRLLLEIVSSIYHIFKLEFRHALMHYWSLAFIIFNFNYIYKRRLLIKKIRIKSDQEIFNEKIIFNQSIIKKYFLLKKQKFSEIIK